MRNIVLTIDESSLVEQAGVAQHNRFIDNNSSIFLKPGILHSLDGISNSS